MVRLPERRSRSARWSRRLAIFAVPLVVLTTLLHRFGSLDTTVALVLVGVSLALALAALLLGLVAAGRIWTFGHAGAGAAATGVILALATLALPAWTLTALATRPRLHDVTTDWTAQLAFDAALRARGENANSLDYPGPQAARVQQAHYPEIVPLTLNYTPDLVYEAATALVADRGWRVLAAAPPTVETNGHIEAEARTLVFGFRDDVLIRLRRLGPETTRVDMRSASRYGEHDMGANAARIYDFFTDLGEFLETGLLPGQIPPEPGEEEE